MTRNKIKIAITGGIGSGKSTVSEIIRASGLPVFSCDEIYEELLTGGGLAEKIAKVFGGVLTENGFLDRRKLSEIVFNNPSSLKKLNDITHSEIMKAAFKKMQSYNISFLEVPLLFESCLESNFDDVIVVLREYEDRIVSVAERDGLDRFLIEQRINCQFDYDKCDFAKYYVIHNNSNLDDLRLSTTEILEAIKEKYLKNF